MRETWDQHVPLEFANGYSLSPAANRVRLAESTPFVPHRLCVRRVCHRASVGIGPTFRCPRHQFSVIDRGLGSSRQCFSQQQPVFPLTRMPRHGALCRTVLFVGLRDRPKPNPAAQPTANSLASCRKLARGYSAPNEASVNSVEFSLPI